MIAVISDRIVRGEIEAATARGAFRQGFRLLRYSHPELWIEVESAKREMVFLLRFELTSYDADPPQVRVVDESGADVSSERHPLRANDQVFPAHDGVGIPRFLCIDGTRDYYLYSGHQPSVTGIGWEQQRAARPLSSLLLAMSDKFASGEWS